MLVFASRITNLTDARYFAAREADFLGFNLETGTPGYLDPVFMKAMREWVEGPRIVGEFSLSPAHVVREAAAFYGLDAVLVHAPQHLNELPALEGLNVILAVDGAAQPDELAGIFRNAAPWTTLFLLDFSEKKSGWPEWRARAAEWVAFFNLYPTLLSLDVPAEELPEILEQLRPAGLVLRGGEEEQVGVKSFDEIEAILDRLRP